MLVSPNDFRNCGCHSARPELDVIQEAGEETARGGATTCIDVGAYVEPKIRAIARHRTQYPIEPDLFPLSMLQDMMGREYFVQIHPPRPMAAELFV